MIAKVVGYNLPQGSPGPTQVIVDRAPTLDRHSPDRGAKFLLAKFLLCQFAAREGVFRAIPMFDASS
jgi:hypothetical protein